MKSRTTLLMKAMYIIALMIFIGVAIHAGSILVSYIVSLRNPVAAKNLYNGLDLHAYLDQSFVNYTFVVWYRILFLAMQAYIALKTFSLLSSINIDKPFNADTVRLLSRISVCILILWLLAVINNLHVAILEKTNGITPEFISQDVIFLAGIIYVFAQIFKRGAEIQSENELTV